jgi:hypothetical protein
MRCVLGAYASSPPELCNVPLAMNRGGSCKLTNTDPPNAASQQGRWPVTSTTLKGVHGLHPCDKEISTSWQHDATLHGQHKSDKELFLSQDFSLPIASANTLSGPEHHGMDRQAHPYRGTRGATWITLASIQGICTLFLFFLFPLVKEKTNIIQRQKGR